MEIFLVIIGVAFLFIMLSAKSGVGIKSSLIKEIHNQRHNNLPSKSYPSISLDEAFEVLSPYDANNKYGSSIKDYREYSFWALVDGEPCSISVKREDFKKTGIKLLVTTVSEHNSIISSLGMTPTKVPTNLRNI